MKRELESDKLKKSELNYPNEKGTRDNSKETIGFETPKGEGEK